LVELEELLQKIQMQCYFEILHYGGYSFKYPIKQIIEVSLDFQPFAFATKSFPAKKAALAKAAKSLRTE
jgi:hypothetical protein